MRFWTAHSSPASFRAKGKMDLVASPAAVALAFGLEFTSRGTNLYPPGLYTPFRPRPSFLVSLDFACSSLFLTLSFPFLATNSMEDVIASSPHSLFAFSLTLSFSLSLPTFIAPRHALMPDHHPFPLSLLRLGRSPDTRPTTVLPFLDPPPQHTLIRTHIGLLPLSLHATPMPSFNVQPQEPSLPTVQYKVGGSV